MRFKYKAIDKYGITREGVIIAQTEDDVVSYLGRLELTPISINKEKLSFIYNLISRFLEKISLEDKIYLYQNLNLMIKSGIDIGRGIEILMEEVSSLGLKNFLINLKFGLEQGKKISEVFSAFSNYFSNIEISIISAGEESGKIEKNLTQLVESLTQAKQTRSRIISSLIYPAILISMAFILLVGIFTLVLPRIALVFKEMPAKIPLFTKIVFEISLFLRENIFIILTLILIGLISFLIIGIKFGLFKILWKFFQLKIGFIKKAVILKSLADISFNFAILMESGLPIVKSLEILEGVASYYLHKEGIREIREKLLPQGKTLGEAFKEVGVFPSNFVALLSVGEKSGNISSNLTLISQFYRENFDFLIKNLTTIIEPIILIIVGLIVAAIAVAVILPIYNVITTGIG